MTVSKEHIKQELDNLNEQQLKEVADLITSIKFRTQAIEKTPKKRLSELYGVLHTTIAYPSKEAIRQIVGESLAQKNSTEKS
ncbi:hypothetical protein [Nostoc sp.]|uniref:hypothetical protein n=1 Tax=Nostoc sp. TaxID=1180 RepID=UPI002FF5DD75